MENVDRQKRLTEKQTERTIQTSKNRKADRKLKNINCMVNKAILIDRCSTILILLMAILIDLIRRYQ